MIPQRGPPLWITFFSPVPKLGLGLDPSPIVRDGRLFASTIPSSNPYCARDRVSKRDKGLGEEQKTITKKTKQIFVTEAFIARVTLRLMIQWGMGFLENCTPIYR